MPRKAKSMEHIEEEIPSVPPRAAHRHSGDPASYIEPVDRQSSATPSTEIQQELPIYESPDQPSRLSKDSDIDSEEYMVMRDLKVPPGSGSENFNMSWNCSYSSTEVLDKV